jgi:uncharacterized membrane protein
MNFSNKKSLRPFVLSLFLIDFISFVNPFHIVGNFIILALLLILPGYLMMLMWSKFTVEPIKLASIIYVVALSLAFLMLTGLIINTVGPIIGISRPLARIPILIIINIFIAAAIYITARSNELRLPKLGFNFSFNRFDVGLIIYSSTLLISSVAGTQILNNGGSNLVTFITELGLALSVLLPIVLFKKIHRQILPVLIFLISLSLLLSYSMRSNYLMGWDIHQEYYVFQLTNIAKHWSSSKFTSPYNACLSITILPTIFSSLLHISGIYIYKFIFQIISSFIPVIVYIYSRNIFRKYDDRLAYLSALLLASQTWFFIQAAALLRQQIALFFFGALLLSLFERKQYRSRALPIIFATSLILSHYSTAYVVFALLSIYIIILTITNKRDHKLVSLPFVVIFFLTAFLWQAQITKTSQHFISTLGQTIVSLPESLNENNIKSGIDQSAFSSGNQDTSKNAAKAYSSTTKSYHYSGSDFYNSTTYSNYVPIPTIPLIVEPKVMPLVANALTFISRVSKYLLTEILALYGLVVFYIYKIKNKNNKDSPNFKYFILTLSSLILIFVLIILPELKFDYNLTRLYTQSLIFLAPLTVYGGLNLFKKIGTRAYMLVAVILLVFMLYSDGLIAFLVGGATPITITNKSQDYQYYYTKYGEITAAEWLGEHYDKNNPINADELSGLILIAYGNIPSINPSIVPTTITKNSYVYLSNTNLSGTTYLSYQQTFLSINTPTKFLNANKDRVYVSGTASIYK